MQGLQCKACRTKYYTPQYRHDIHKSDKYDLSDFEAWQANQNNHVWGRANPELSEFMEVATGKCKVAHIHEMGGTMRSQFVQTNTCDFGPYEHPLLFESDYVKFTHRLVVARCFDFTRSCSPCRHIRASVFRNCMFDWWWGNVFESTWLATAAAKQAFITNAPVEMEGYGPHMWRNAVITEMTPHISKMREDSFVENHYSGCTVCEKCHRCPFCMDHVHDPIFAERTLWNSGVSGEIKAVAIEDGEVPAWVNRHND